MMTKKLSPLEVTDTELQQLLRQGYRRTSCKYGIVARVDREDWMTLMSHVLRGPLSEIMGNQQMWEDHYRRCFSRDKLELGAALGAKFPSSADSLTGYATC